MPHDLQTWLSQMPPESEIEARIAEVERELDLLTALKNVRMIAAEKHGTPSDEDRSGPESKTQTENDDEPQIAVDELRKRMSPERIRIMRVIYDSPQGNAGILEVAGALRVDRDNVASNMQRMVSAGLLKRVGHGRYALTSGSSVIVEEASRQSALGEVGM